MDKYKFRYNLIVNILLCFYVLSPLMILGWCLKIVMLDKPSLEYMVIPLIMLTSLLQYVTLKSIDIIKRPIGEAITRLIIQSFCHSNHYINMHDLLFRDQDIGYFHIDHLIITSKSVAVIKTNYTINYDIYGSEFEEDWAYVKKGKHKKVLTYPTDNQLNKNIAYIEAIKKILGEEDIRCYNIVSYLDTVNIKLYDLSDENSRCIYTQEVPEVIKGLVKNDMSEKLGIAKISKLVCLIRDSNIKDKNIRREYFKKNINKILEEENVENYQGE